MILTYGVADIPPDQRKWNKHRKALTWRATRGKKLPANRKKRARRVNNFLKHKRDFGG